MVPGAGLSTIEVNASGKRISNAHLESNDAVGLQLYLIDLYLILTILRLSIPGNQEPVLIQQVSLSPASFFGGTLQRF